jgi:hypothetical protein
LNDYILRNHPKVPSCSKAVESSTEYISEIFFEITDVVNRHRFRDIETAIEFVELVSLVGTRIRDQEARSSRILRIPSFRIQHPRVTRNLLNSETPTAAAP